MLYYAGVWLIYFLYDKTKNKIINYFVHKGAINGIKLLTYTPEWERKNNIQKLERLLDWVFL